jgi:MFS family permease
MALTAALLGWMFDGLEMGLFPLVARPALRDLLGVSDDALIARWIAVATAGFLVGAATGGVLFGWLGDRIGRVRAMTLSVLTYALFSGGCGLATEAWQVAVMRFIAALGMGGEWSLGVALVMEVWPNRSRALLAGIIGAAANLGYLLIALVGLGLGAITRELHGLLLDLGFGSEWAEYLTANSAWRLVMLLGATPALLTFFIRLCVPESARWLHEKEKGAASHWASRDLLGVLIGAAGACGLIALWAFEVGWTIRLAGSLLALAVTTGGYLFPIIQYLQRAESNAERRAFTLKRMLLAATLSGIPLLATWASVQQTPPVADRMREAEIKANPEWSALPATKQHELRSHARGWTQFWGGLGACVGCVLGALAGDWLGRRITYLILCLSSLGACQLLFLGNTNTGPGWMASMFVAGGTTAAFYGWLPLYLPELFRTSVRATGQGFGFNFGRIIAAVGVLQLPNLMQLFDNDFARACSVLSAIYLLGALVIWLAPETRGKPLPE